VLETLVHFQPPAVFRFTTFNFTSTISCPFTSYKVFFGVLIWSGRHTFQHDRFQMVLENSSPLWTPEEISHATKGRCRVGYCFGVALL